MRSASLEIAENHLVIGELDEAETPPMGSL
jgi:hypothetical protein